MSGTGCLTYYSAAVTATIVAPVSNRAVAGSNESSRMGSCGRGLSTGAPGSGAAAPR